MALQDEMRAAREERPSSPPAAGGTRRRPRWDLALAWAVIVGPFVAIAVTIAVRQQVGDLEARLVRDTNELFARAFPRPVHVDLPSPGAMGDAVARHLPPLDAAARALEKDDPAIQRTRDVVSGAAPLDDLPAWSAAALERLGPDLDGLLAATRAERADLPDTRDRSGPLEGGGWAGWQLAATLAGVRMRIALAAAEPERAVRDGLDALALGRDAAIARELVGRMVGAAVIARLTPPMAAAIGALPDARARRDALRRVRAIRDALPPFSRTLADELTLSQLYAGEALPARARAALDPRAAAVLRAGLRDTAFWQRLAIRDGWRALRSAQDELVAAADLPDAERAAAFDAVNDRVMRFVNPFAAIALPSYRNYARRADAATRRLDALVLAAAAAAFRDERGRWPTSVADVAAARDLSPAEAARLADAALERRDGGHAFSIRVPVPPTEEPAVVELVLERAPTRPGRR